MLLFESSRDNLLMPYLNLMREKGIECSLSQLKQFLLAKFVNEGNIMSLSLESNYYLAGVARYYFEGKLTVNKNVNAMYPKIKDVFNQDICQRLSVLIVILRNAYIDSVGTQFEQPEDFGTLSLEKLLRKYNKAINAELGIGSEKEKEKPEKVDDGLNRDEHVGDGYTFDILYSYEDAKKYHRFTEPGAWCITYGEQHYNGYIRRLKIHYVIFRKDGWENVPRQKGPNWTSLKPQDEYGNSLIALLQSNENGAPVYITSRWNHGSYADNSQCEADHAYTPEEFKRVTGVSDGDLKRIFDIWEKDRKKNGEKVSQSRSELNKKRDNVLRIFKYAQMRINGGNFDNAFGDYSFSVNDLLSKDGKLFGLKTTINYTYEFLFSLRKKEFLLCPEEFRVNENPYIFKIYGVNMTDGYITMYNKELLKFRFHVNDNGDLKEPVFVGDLRENKNLNFGVIREAVSAALKKYIGCI